jgi:DNA-binding NarL/FixJ family response regulator
MNGGTHYSPTVLATLMRKARHQTRAEDERKDLTERELEILKLIVQEYSTAAIADQLFISPRTVDTHRKNIMAKTQSRTLVGLIKYAFRNDLIQ